MVPNASHTSRKRTGRSACEVWRRRDSKGAQAKQAWAVLDNAVVCCRSSLSLLRNVGFEEQQENEENREEEENEKSSLRSEIFPTLVLNTSHTSRKRTGRSACEVWRRFNSEREC